MNLRCPFCAPLPLPTPAQAVPDGEPAGLPDFLLAMALVKQAAGLVGREGVKQIVDKL
jgi:hypothetical protein